MREVRFLCITEILFSSRQVNLSEAVRVTPSLPQRGKQPKGSTPLDPRSRYSQSTFLGALAFGGCPRGGGGSTVCWSPQEQFLRKMWG
jgi:hypothetical protein